MTFYSFEVCWISFKQRRSYNSRFAAAAHREAWWSYCKAASGEGCPGLKRIIAYAIKLCANGCCVHTNNHSRSSNNLLSIACIHTDRTSWDLDCISHLSSLGCLIYISMILFVVPVLLKCCFKLRNTQNSSYKDHLHYYHISRIFKIFTCFPYSVAKYKNWL